MTDELIWKKPRALRVGRNIALRYSDSKLNYGSFDLESELQIFGCCQWG
jgi:hypothetical protein